MSQLGHAMDQFSAHLDRAWDMVQQGNFREAQAAANEALRLDASSPEVHNILGYLAAIDGDTDTAIDHYTQAYELDDTFLEAMLNAADLYVHPIGDYDRAIELCETALSITDTTEEQIEALLLMFDAMLGKEDMQGAKEVVRRIPPGPYEQPNHAFLIGRALFEIGQAHEAAPLLQEAAAKDPLNAEAWYYLGLIQDEQGQHEEATKAFLKARSLDLKLPNLPWSMSPEVFAKAAERARDSVEPPVLAMVKQATVLVSDVPGIELVADGVDPRALVLIDVGSDASATAVSEASRIFVYQRNVERVAGAPEQVEDVIVEAITREVQAMGNSSDGSKFHSKNR